MSELLAGQTARQAPGSSRAYALDWGKQVLAEGIKLADVGTIEIRPNDGSLTLTYQGMAQDERSVLIRLSGGVAGRRYRVLHRVTTTGIPAQTLVQSFHVLVRE